jgi:membrane protease YdiL (CAAX protease family)
MTSLPIATATDACDREQRSTLRPYVEATGFVAVWMALGVGFRFIGWDAVVTINTYLLVGIPLMILFQCCVRGERLVTLWVRHAERFNIGVVGLLVAAALTATPANQLVAVVAHKPLQIVVALWDVAAIAGAVGAGFCIRNMSLHGLRKGLPGFLMTCGLGIGLMAIAALAGGTSSFPIGKAIFFTQQFLLYFPVCFALEEVVFRGMIDSHLQQQPATGRKAWLSAVAGSILWGLWHLPLIPIPDVLSATVIVPSVCLVHALIGVPLSFCWRSSGSLLLPCAAHAFIDAFRNAVLM